MQNHMDLKDLPDSELAEMEIVFRRLVDWNYISPDYVFRALRNIGIEEAVEMTQEEYRECDRKVRLLADWGFVYYSNGNLSNMNRSAKLDQLHRPLEWHREQARLNYKKELESIKKQKRTDRLNRNATKITSAAAIVAVTFGIFQWYDSRNSRSDVQRLEERLTLIEYNVDKILLNASISTTNPQKSQPDSITSKPSNSLLAKDTVKPR